MGLAGAARPTRALGVGVDRAPAGRLPGALQQVASRAGSQVEDQAQLIAGLDAVARKLGGLTKAWRFDRMATVCHPASGKVTASFAAVAKHYGVSVKICPPRRGNRKGVVEKANHTAAQRCWRTLPNDATIAGAQAVFDRFAQLRGDTRLRPVQGSGGARGKASVATVAKAEPLAPVPATPFPATITEQRVVSAQALAAWRGNFYSVPPELARATVQVSPTARVRRRGDRHRVIGQRHRHRPPPGRTRRRRSRGPRPRPRRCS